MGVDLISSHGDVSFNWSAWEHCLDVALAFGWQPAGTVAPTDFRGDWDGTYFTNDLQEVTDEDARALGAALHRAVAAIRTGHDLTALQAKAGDEMNVNVVCRLADYSERGGFAIL